MIEAAVFLEVDAKRASGPRSLKPILKPKRLRDMMFKGHARAAD